MINVEPLSDLLFVYQSGCAACETAMPELDKFATDNPRLMIVKLQAGSPITDRLIGKKIRATPTYVFRRGREGFFHEGALTSKQIGQWLDKILRDEEGDDSNEEEGDDE